MRTGGHKGHVEPGWSRVARAGAVLYWSAAVLLTLFGVVDLIAIGAPLLIVGVAMLALGRWRHRPSVFVPGMSGAVGLIVGAFLLLPLGCTASAVAVAGGQVGPETTRCATALWFDYVGGAGYQPPYLPALLAGIVTAVAAAVLTRRLIVRSGAP